MSKKTRENLEGAGSSARAEDHEQGMHGGLAAKGARGLCRRRLEEWEWRLAARRKLRLKRREHLIAFAILLLHLIDLLPEQSDFLGQFADVSFLFL